MSNASAIKPDWNRLFETATGQEGQFTTKQAAESGYSAQLLVHYVQVGRAVRVRRGICRLVHFPAGEHEDLVTAVVPGHKDQRAIRNDGMKYDGLRFRVECRITGKLYAQPFSVDVAFGDPMFGEPEVVTAHDVLDSVGIAPPTLRVYPIETHVAEKLHAYTMPRERPNSRLKDLPDLALLATVRALDAQRLRAALEQTFTFRDTHALPAAVPSPLTWTTPYAVMAREDQLVWPTLDDVATAVQTFLDPVLVGGLNATWEHGRWAWQPW